MKTAAQSSTKSVKAKKEKELNWNYIKFFKRPEHVDTLPEGQVISKVFSAANYCYALNETTNDLFSWGFGYNYVLGSRDEENQYKPYLVHPKMFFECKIRAVGTGNNHVVVLTSASPDDNNAPQFDFDLPLQKAEQEEKESDYHTAQDKEEVKDESDVEQPPVIREEKAQVIEAVAEPIAVVEMALSVEPVIDASSAGSKKRSYQQLSPMSP